MTYIELIEKVFSFAGRGRMKSCFSSMQRFDRWQGQPHRQFASIQISGTNGKGSVAFKIAAALRETGFRVGLYTSPHISSFRERIQINGALISEEFIKAFLPKLFSFIEKESIQPTFFELLTALAFAYFAEEKVDIAVLEAGLGGQLDATNIVTPILSVITSIDYDHMEILGTTLDEIAAAKAGIIKPGIPAVVGPRAQFLPIIQASDHLVLAPSAQGFYDRENNSIARCALEVLRVPEDAIVKGLARRPPCRFEIIYREPSGILPTSERSKIGHYDGRKRSQNLTVCGINSQPIILDVAHNPDGFSRLCEAIQEQFPDRLFHVMFAMGKEKDPVLALEKIKSIAARIACVSNNHSRLATAEELTRRLNEGGFSTAYPASIEETLKISEPLLVCGSFFIMGDVRRLLGIREPIDPVPLIPLRQSKKDWVMPGG